MKKEDIEKAAVDSCVIENSIFNPELTPYYEQGFIAGAEWRINSVWHDASELPTEEENILGVSEEYGCFICGPNISAFAELAKDVKITQWAYFKDLIPNTEE